MVSLRVRVLAVFVGALPLWFSGGEAGSGTALVSDRALSAALDTLAARNGISRQDLRVDPAALALENSLAGTLPLTAYLLREPERTPATLRGVAEGLEAGGGAAARMDLLLRLYHPEAPLPRTGLPAEWRKATTAREPLLEAMKRLFEKTGERFQGKDLERVRRDAAALDTVVARETAGLLMAALQAASVRDAWVKRVGFRQGGAFDSKSKHTAGRLREVLESWSRTDSTEGSPPGLDTVPGVEDLPALWATGRDLAAALEETGARLEGAMSEGVFQYEWPSPRGRVAIGGMGANTYRGSYFLVLDLGGDDLYHGTGSVSGESAVALILDLGGYDRYEPGDSAVAGPGGAILGYAGIADLGQGNDVYRGVGWSQGFGFLGMGWLWDAGGDDEYEDAGFGQGAGLLGFGLLADDGGTDRYRMAVPEGAHGGFGQGYAGAWAIGALVDRGAGGDTYVFEAPPGSQPEVTYAAFVQGAASGERGGRVGGLGFLVDGGGDDAYRSLGWSQGVGGVGGLGALIDLGGADTYRAGARAQGFGGRVGLGLLLDAGGDDRYEAGENASHTLGVGEDLGWGLFLDGAGADVYAAGPLSVGASDRQGAGWFLDLEGRDTFRIPEEALAYVSDGSMDGEGGGPRGDPWRWEVPGIAVFVDFGALAPELARRGFDPGAGRTVVAPRGVGPGWGGGICILGPGDR